MLDFRPFIPLKDQRNEAISKWSIGEHIDHCCKVTHLFEKTLLNSTPGEKQPHFHPLKFIVFTFGFIPRGKGQAKESIFPSESFTEQDLQASVKASMDIEERLPTLNPHFWLEHPVFGVLNSKQAMRFLSVHNHHHLKIILDIKDK